MTAHSFSLMSCLYAIVISTSSLKLKENYLFWGQTQTTFKLGPFLPAWCQCYYSLYILLISMGKEFLPFVLISSAKSFLCKEIKTLTFCNSRFIATAHPRCCSHCWSVPFFVGLLITQVGIGKPLILLLSQDIYPFDFLNPPPCLMVLI